MEPKMVTPVRRAQFEWKIDEPLAVGFAKQLRAGVRPDDIQSLPADLAVLEVNVSDTPPTGTGYRYVTAIYEARDR